jgi:putative transport protein
MGPIINTLAAMPVLTLFVVIGLGYLLGQINIFGFRFGLAGVLFVGIAIGALSPNIALPEIVSTLGLIIFVYTIGIQSGPAFFASFKDQGKRANLLAITVLVFGALLSLGIGHALHWSRASIAGLFSGALTNTPAVAAARDRLHFEGQVQGLSADQLRDLTEQPTIAFGLAYPMGVIGVLLAFQLLNRMWKPKFAPAVEQEHAIRSQDFVVRNPGICGLRLGDVLELHRDSGFVISRVRQGGKTLLARGDVVLNEGDILVVVGDDPAFERARHLFGEPTEEQIELDRSELDFRRMFVSSHEVVGKRIGDLALEHLHAAITRVRRGDIDVVPTPDTILEYGDRVRVLTRRENMDAVSHYFGDSIRGTAETDFGSVAIGMVMGALVGMIPIPMRGTVVRLGLAGGPLLVALVLGKLERTGGITWKIPISANLTLRQIGLLLFFAGVGTRAGYPFGQTLMTNGWQFIAVGTVVTFAVALTTMIVGYKLLGIPYDAIMGITSGIHTEPASLTYATNLTRNDRPNTGYTTVYPIAMIAKIVLAQLLV